MSASTDSIWQGMSAEQKWAVLTSPPKVAGPWKKSEPSDRKWWLYQRETTFGESVEVVPNYGVFGWEWVDRADERRCEPGTYGYGCRSLADALRAADTALVKAGYELVGGVPNEVSQ